MNKNQLIQLENFQNFLIFKITRNCTLQEFNQEVDSNPSLEFVANLIPTHMFFSSPYKSQEKDIYLTHKNGTTISLLTMEEKVTIDIKEQIKGERNVKEWVLKLDLLAQDFRLSVLKHNEQKSTYFTKFFEKGLSHHDEALYYSKEEGEKEVMEVVKKLESFKNIDKILDIENIKSITTPEEESSI